MMQIVPFVHQTFEKPRAWTHEICWDCWWERFPARWEDDQLAITRWPTRIKNPDTVRCCFCGQPNRSGIFYRNDPADPDMACAQLEARQESGPSPAIPEA